MDALWKMKMVLFVVLIQAFLASLKAEDVDLVYDLPSESERKSAQKYVDLVYDISSGEIDPRTRRGSRMSMKTFKVLRNRGPDRVRIKNLKRFPSLFKEP